MEIVFIRHAEKKEGEGDLGLSKKGILQAKNLARRLSKQHFDELYCSSLQKAIETAKIISKKINIPIKINSALDEINSEIFKKEKNEWNNEELVHYLKLKKFLEKFTKRAKENKRILIIAHGNINRLILSILLELNPKNLIRFRLLETGISEVYWVPKFKNWRLKYWNDISHQPKELVEGVGKY